MNKNTANIQSDYIWSIIYTIINASIQVGKGPDRWNHVNQLMIEKQKGNQHINKLRRINIFEADYNTTLTYFWPHNANKNDGSNINMGQL